MVRFTPLKTGLFMENRTSPSIFPMFFSPVGEKYPLMAAPPKFSSPNFSPTGEIEYPPPIPAQRERVRNTDSIRQTIFFKINLQNMRRDRQNSYHTPSWPFPPLLLSEPHPDLHSLLPLPLLSGQKKENLQPGLSHGRESWNGN